MSSNRTTRQTTAVTAVIGIHLIIGFVLVVGTTIRNSAPHVRPLEAVLVPPEAPPLDLLKLTPPPSEAKFPKLTLPPPGDIPIVPRNYDPVVLLPREGKGEINPLPQRVQPIVRANVKDLRALAEAASGCYPSASRRLGEEGLVLLKVYVTSAGSVTDAAVESSSGVARLDEAAVRCVRSSQLHGMWVPRTANGQPVGAWMQLPWRWRLR